MTSVDPAARVAVVTDSTASFPDGFDHGTDVVPLHVIVDGAPFREKVDVTDHEVAEQLRAGTSVTTSQPSPQEFLEVYERVARAGARAIVSVHLSGDLSGTVHAAALAATRSPVPVRVVDSRTTAMALGFAAAQAARAARGGASARAVERRALAVASTSSATFLVESLDHLRRGGRLSGPAAALGTVLGVRPLLAVRDGRIVVAQKVRTRAAAVDRLVSTAVEQTERCSYPLVAVHHLGDPDRAHDVAGDLARRLGVHVEVASVSAVVGAHVGEGVLGVMVADVGAVPGS
ncbi:DegV family protein [Paraoerskovia marina]|uniref:EDD domain protein, DegV family n=1 Tax=Paraoerskovia marina TaxID=545619 RepID=A0A1H1RT92_9CELL|nr:DegV family protein [Paraoerskovia marina]SDS38875.1 EDD domain protein, DegV family [Paraoerskovia marina]